MLFIAFPLCAEEVQFDVSLSRHSIAIGSRTELKLTFNNTQRIPAPQIPEVDGIEVNYVGPSSMMSIANGQMKRSVTHVYYIAAFKEGTFNFGPVRFNYKNDTYTSNSVTVTVSKNPGSSKNTKSNKNNQAKATFDDYVFLRIEPTKVKAYVNEPFEVVVKLYASRFGLRDIEFPKMQSNGISYGDFSQPKQYQEVINGNRFEVIEFRANAFGTKNGVFKIGPAQVTANVLLRSSRSRGGSLFDGFFDDDFFGGFFGSYDLKETTLTSSVTYVSILPIPSESKPDTYKGAMGRFNMNVTVNPRNVKVGDPVTVRAEIVGEGNFNSVDAPIFADNNGFKIYDPQISLSDNKKVFEFIALPTNADVQEVPQLTFSYFDTRDGKYRTIKKGPWGLTVNPSKDGRPLTIVDLPKEGRKATFTEVLGRDIVYIKDTPGELVPTNRVMFKSKIFLIINIVLGALYLIIRFILKRTKRFKTDVDFARRMRAYKKASKRLKGINVGKLKPEEFYDTVFKILQDYIGDLFGLPSQGITVETVDHLLVDGKITGDASDGLREILNECDMVRYAPSEFNENTIKNTYKKAVVLVDQLEKARKK